MSFNRSPQQDGRRRRALFDEAAENGPSRTAARTRTSKANAVSRSRAGAVVPYGSPEFVDHLPRVTDLVPMKWRYIIPLTLLGLGVIAGLEWLYSLMPRLAPLTTDGSVESFDLDAEGTLAVWFSSLVLLLSCGVSLIIYSVRRHTIKDYNARYRIWIWAAACWLLMSVDETASLHESFKELMAYLTGSRIVGDGSMWWVMAYLLILIPVGIRLTLDMRNSRLALGVMMLAGASFGMSVVVQLQWIMPESGARGVMLEEGCEMLGDVLLLLGLVLHSRYVLLEAQGLLPPRRTRAEKKGANSQQDAQGKGSSSTASKRRQSRARKETTPARKSARRTRETLEEDDGQYDDELYDDEQYDVEEDDLDSSDVEPEEIARPAASRKKNSASTAGHSKLRIDEAEASPPESKLSKAQRKALRKQKRLEQR
jgi:hypothetical protein